MLSIQLQKQIQNTLASRVTGICCMKQNFHKAFFHLTMCFLTQNIIPFGLLQHLANIENHSPLTCLHQDQKPTTTHALFKNFPPFSIGFKQIIQNKEMNFNLTTFYANIRQMSLEMKVNYSCKNVKAWHGLGQVVARLNKQSFEILFIKTAGRPLK